MIQFIVVYTLLSLVILSGIFLVLFGFLGKPQNTGNEADSLGSTEEIEGLLDLEYPESGIQDAQGGATNRSFSYSQFHQGMLYWIQQISLRLCRINTHIRIWKYKLWAKRHKPAYIDWECPDPECQRHEERGNSQHRYWPRRPLLTFFTYGERKDTKVQK